MSLPTPAEMAALHAAGFPMERAWTTAEFTGLLNLPGTRAFGDARAFALTRIAADEVELLTMATAPNARRQGLARGLMAQWLQTAQEDGAQRAFLDVAADNRAALTLYVSCGFEQTALRKGYYARPGHPLVDALLMARDLSPA